MFILFNSFTKYHKITKMRYKCATNFKNICIFAPEIVNINMVQIIARESRNGTDVSLSVRMYLRGVVNNAVSLGVILPKNDWQVVSMLLDNATQAEKSGNAVCLRDNLAISLWSIKKKLEVLMDAGTLTLQAAREVVTEVLHQQVVEERERHKAEIENPVKTQKKMTLKEWIREFIRQCEDGERLKRRSTKMITPGTIKSYKGTLAQLEAYEVASHRLVDFDDVTIDFYDSWKAFFIKKMYSPNTIGRHVKNLKTFLFAAEDMKLTTRDDYKSERFSVDHEDVDNVYLTEERISQLFDFDPMDDGQLAACINALPKGDRKRMMELTEREASRKALAVAKDVFLVGCLTGQRISDYKRISSNMIVELNDGRRYIDITQEKTAKPIYIPLDERVTEILNRYDGVLPKVYDQKINMRIKIVGHLLGWTENAGVRELHGTMAIDKGKKFYECIKTHTARRTFATNAYKRGVPLSSIMAVTGHSSEAMLRKYLKLDNKERAMIAAKDFENAKATRLKVSK